MSEPDKIELKGMRFYGYHGVEKEEKTLGQWFEIDVMIWGDFSEALFTDKVESAVDYSQVYDMTREIVEGESVNLLEHLAFRIMNSILPLPLVEKILVRVKKPQAPVKGPLAYAGVEIVRCKHEG
ncbi:MAG TPA: dihydroneopterin aldolase [Clostridia bacterium]|jgi:dihydroneopterin aldolase|nr:dihydroneopterin aldolase [Clostridia bacterium]HHY05932.1 dihydroneopterin aldolase [Clostridia bacterium]